MRVRKPSALGAVLAALMLTLIMTGCAEPQKKQTFEMEQTLSAAGFQLRPADTPEKLSQLQTLTQRKLIRHQHKGKAIYVYVDTTYCQCLYVGDQKAYQKFRGLALQKQITEEQRRAEREDQPAQIDWQDWITEPVLQ
jgi:galactose mutarotase-like enzyme